MKVLRYIFCIFVLLNFSVKVYSQTIADSVKVPNVFTPNADGTNDLFKPIVNFENDVKSYSMSIYDRYGVKIFETIKLKQYWDGRTTSGMPCTEGTYFYVLQITFKSDEQKLTGFVQLFR